MTDNIGKWNCPNCGSRELNGKFCPNCGTKKPETTEKWNCQNCGMENLTSKFCPKCGTKKPETTFVQSQNANKKTDSFNYDTNSEIGRIITQIEQIASIHNIELPPTFRKIKARANDPMLYVGLIGEFSSGKSTLVNAWLGDDLLKTDILQATTAAPTLLKDSSEYQISTLMKNGDVIDSAKSSETEKFKATFLDYLHKVSADENYSKDIKLVSLSYPNEVLRNKGFALIDTPGANADNERHKEISGWAVEELCDVAIVIIPANIPYSESLDSFIKTYLDKSFKKCVFVITKVDSIRRESELKSLISTVKTRVETSLGIEVPEIITFSPRLYLDALTGENEVAERKQHFISEFEENTAKLFELLYQKRDEYISFTLSEILKALISEIQEKLKSKKAEYERKQKLVAANMLPDLDKWFSDRYDNLKQFIDSEYSETKTNAENWLRTYRSNFSTIIISNFNSLQEVKQVEGFMNESWLNENYFNYSNSEISNYLQSAVTTVRESVEAKFGELGEEFSNVYRNLATVELNLQVNTNMQNSSLGAYSFSAVNQAASIVAQEKKNISIGGSVIGGGIGLFLGGPLGAVIGANVGKWVSKFFVSVEDVKQKYRPSLEQLLDSYFGNIVNVFNKEFDKAHSTNINSLSQMIGEYKNSYSQLIEGIQKQEKNEQQELSRNAVEAEKTTENLSLTIKSLEKSDAIKIVSTNKFSFLHELPEIMQTEPLTSDSNTDGIAALLGRAANVTKHIERFSSDNQSTKLPDIKTAEDLYLQGKFDESFKISKPLAEAGNSRAMLLLSLFYDTGLGNIPVDKNESNKWSNNAIAMNDPIAILGKKMDENEKSISNITDVVKKIREMTQEGDIFAGTFLGAYYFSILADSDTDDTENKALLEETVKLLEKSAEQGEFIAQFYLGTFYIGQENYEQGFKLLLSSADKGWPEAQKMLGDAYLNIKENPTEAFKWYMKAAEKGNAEAENMLGVCYSEGNGVAEDPNKAFAWWKLAAEQKLPIAMSNLGFAYINGYGVKENEKLAFEWYMKAAKAGEDGAQYQIGTCYENGACGVPQNHYEAFKWYMKSAEQGNAEAQNSVGLAYFNGIGTETNASEGFKWFMYAAEQGLPVAMNNIAFCYENGYGVQQNNNEMFEWYMKAAEAGYTESQYKVGLCYFNDQQNKVAFKWLKKAADQGHEEAQKFLKEHYYY